MRNKSLSLSYELFEKVKSDILQENFQQGMKLTEHAICDKYHVSRTPVREALRLLESEGLVEIFPNRGAFVIGFNRGDLKDLYILREIYEVQAVRWAIERIYDDEFDKLEESYEFMKFYTNKGDRRRILEINQDFHRAIYEAAHNRMLENTLLLYQSYIANTVYKSSRIDTDLNLIFKEHKAIFKAFQSADPDAGERAMRLHIRNASLR